MRIRIKRSYDNIIRGGSWDSYVQDVRAVARAWPGILLKRDDDLGFRIVRRKL